MIEQLVKGHKRNLGFEFLEEARVFVAGLDGVLVLQPAYRTTDNILHLARRLVMLGHHQVQMRFGQMAVKLHARVGETAMRTLHKLQTPNPKLQNPKTQTPLSASAF